MKKIYEAPAAEKVEFQYEEQVTASSCISVWVNEGTEETKCKDQEHQEYLN